MARVREPNRIKALEMWKQSNGKIKLKDIAEHLSISEGKYGVGRTRINGGS
ncbi:MULTISPECIES: phage terminase small subunit-related protein [Brevibacillus]|uniref:phage terminase small subunit-related protein n=1 Tax=Brevibacillus TaxID=55080 RepID=UPI003633226E